MAKTINLSVVEEETELEKEVMEHPEPPARLDSGQARLQAMGYRQELRRTFGPLTSFATSLVLMANSGGITGLISVAYTNGGPVSAVWGWFGVSFTNVLVALSMAEIVSAYPCAGGPYCWVLELTKNDPEWLLGGWITGWLNVLGQFATTAGIGSLLANHVANMWFLANGHAFSPVELLLTYAISLVAAGVVSSTTTRGIECFTMFGAAFLVLSNLAIAIILPIVAPVHQSIGFVFTQFNDAADSSNGIPNDAYLFLIGTLMAQFTYIGYEAPAQFAEETRKADRVVPRGIVWSVIGTAVLGWTFILSLLSCIQDPSTLLTGEANGYIVGQIFHDAFMARFGSATGGIVLMVGPLIAIFNAGVLSLTTNARMLWAFSRDGGVPLYRVWSRINKRTQTPTNAVWAMTALAFLLGLPMLWSLTAFQAISSISSIGLYLSYGIPIVIRVWKRNNFEPGPFRLGMFQLPINLAAIAWVITTTVVFALPTVYPVSWLNLNWTPVTVGVVLFVVLFSWYLPGWGARQWYLGKGHTREDNGVASWRQRPSLPGTDPAAVPKVSLLGLMADRRAAARNLLMGQGKAPYAGPPPQLPPRGRMPGRDLLDRPPELGVATPPAGRAAPPPIQQLKLEDPWALSRGPVQHLRLEDPWAPSRPPKGPQPSRGTRNSTS